MAHYSPSKLQSVIESQGRRVYWLAEKADVHPTTIYRFLRGERSMTDDVAAKLADILDIPVEQLQAEREAVSA